MNKSEKASSTFLSGFNCAQSVLAAFCEETGIDYIHALKLATSFGGGMAHQGQTCGAVTGAIMVLGLKAGRYKIEDLGSKEKTYELVDQFMKEFKSLYGSVSCKELLGIDLSTPEGLAIQQEQGLNKQVCPKYVAEAARIVEELIAE